MSARYAVMGLPVAHSLSPMIHQLFAAQMGCELIYEKIQIDLLRFEEQVIAFFQQGGQGLNITLPCKTRAYVMSEERSVRCFEAGAANTLWMEAGRLHADNTDGVGFLRDIGRYIDLTGKRILLLGAGGAASGILGPLLAASPRQLTITNRTQEKVDALRSRFSLLQWCSFSELRAHVEENPYDIVINTTSAGMEGPGLALPPALMATKPFCYDLAYMKGGETPFVKNARAAGCVAVDGLGMLVEQAAESFFIWHGFMPEIESIRRSL